MEQTREGATIRIIKNDHYDNIMAKQMDIKQGKVYNDTVVNRKQEADNMSQQYVTEKDLTQLEEKIDLKIKLAVQPIESKIDVLSEKIENLPTKFENLLLTERQYQDDKAKETRRYIWGTIVIGLVSIGVSIGLNFI